MNENLEYGPYGINAREARYRRNAAAMFDFALNLLALSGYNKGASASVATGIFPAYNESYRNAQAKYERAVMDFKARTADEKLRKAMSHGSGNPAVSYTMNDRNKNL